MLLVLNFTVAVFKRTFPPFGELRNEEFPTEGPRVKLSWEKKEEKKKKNEGGLFGAPEATLCALIGEQTEKRRDCRAL